MYVLNVFKNHIYFKVYAFLVRSISMVCVCLKFEKFLE
jgi:hypothetical protein